MNFTVADAHRGDETRCVARAHEKITAFVRARINNPRLRQIGLTSRRDFPMTLGIRVSKPWNCACCSLYSYLDCFAVAVAAAKAAKPPRLIHHIGRGRHRSQRTRQPIEDDIKPRLSSRGQIL